MKLDYTHTQLLLDRLVSELMSGDDPYLTDPIWAAVFRRVPRHVFLPGFYIDSPDSAQHWVNSADHLDTWLDYVYRDLPLVTRFDESNKPMSSSSMPSMMARFLQLLGVEDRSAVLEIGTGSGYNAAILCERLGSELVTSIDIDSGQVEAARTALANCGYRPELAVADGEQGYARRAPYDRIIATGSVQRIPEPWIDQLGAGGVIVTPLTGRVNHGLVALRVQPNGSLQGRLDRGGAGFMELRRDADGYARRPLRFSADTADMRPLGYPFERCRSNGPDFHAYLRVPGLELGPIEHDERGLASWDDDSWARVVPDEEGGHVVVQAGPRRLWDLYEAAIEEWIELGRPHMDRYGMTITSDRRQYVWLDSPESEHIWEL